MTDEQFDNWWILEGLEEWTLCDRGTRVTVSALKDAPTRWAKARGSEVPAGVVNTLIALAQGGRK